jgi:hypothetical protein
LASSCIRKPYNIVGQWNMIYNWHPIPKTENKILILFLADSTFIASDVNANIPGTWSQKGNKITLTISKTHTEYIGTIDPKKHRMEGTMVDKGDTGTWRANRYDSLQTPQ